MSLRVVVMRKLGSIILWLGISVCWRAEAAPRIFIETADIELGALDSNSKAGHTYVVENRGDKTLRITGISRCDGPCKSYVLETDAIRPGRSARLRFAFDLYGIKGRVSRRRFVTSNDPETPSFPVTLSCTVTPQYQVTPGRVMFDLLDPRSSVLKTTTVIPQSGLRQPLSSVASNSKHFKAQLTSAAGNRSYILEVRTVPPFSDGVTVGRIVLRSTDTNDAACVVRVAAYVRPKLAIIPKRLVLNSMDGEQFRMLFVRQWGGSVAGLRDVLVPSEKFQCEIEEGSVYGDYRIRVYGRGLAGESGKVDDLVIQTDSEKTPRICVPIIVRPAVVLAKRGEFSRSGGKKR